MLGSHLYWIFTWSIGFSWRAKSPLFPPPFDHTLLFRYWLASLQYVSSLKMLVLMKDVHFVAFCKLLGLPFKEPFDQYAWDLAKYTCFIARKRNFFRNMTDDEPIANIDSWRSEDSGPLLSISGKTIAFAPLLRTRKNNELWNLSFFLDVVSAACFSLGLFLLGWQGGLPTLL